MQPGGSRLSGVGAERNTGVSQAGGLTPLPWMSAGAGSRLSGPLGAERKRGQAGDRTLTLNFRVRKGCAHMYPCEKVVIALEQMLDLG